MGFESVRGYVQLASGLGELTRARAREAAQGLLSMSGVGISTGKVAGQVGALAEELFAAATTNRENVTALVRSEVDAAVTRLGLVPAAKLKQSQAEAARLRAEIAGLRSAPADKPVAKKTAAKKSAPKTAAKKTAVKPAAKKTPAKRAAANTSSAASVATTPAVMATTTRRSAVTTRRKPAGT